MLLLTTKFVVISESRSTKLVDGYIFFTQSFSYFPLSQLHKLALVTQWQSKAMLFLPSLNLHSGRGRQLTDKNM